MLPDALDIAIRDWVVLALPTLTKTIFAKQKTSSPRPAARPYATVEARTDIPLSATPYIRTTDTPAGSDFVQERYYQRLVTARITIFAENAKQLVRDLTQSRHDRTVRDANDVSGIVVGQELSVLQDDRQRDNSYETAIQVDYPVSYVARVDGTVGAIETLVQDPTYH